ncbi:MAG: hypothetical protein K2X71_13435, partial [Methylobacterium sp.]|nr:hypothetical protein [Methylobacterium sp.]
MLTRPAERPDMPSLPDPDTLLALLRRAAGQVRASTARALAAEARAEAIARQVDPLLDRVEAELREAAARVEA